MLISEIAWEYQRLKSSEPKSIDAFVARNVAKDKAKELMEKLNQYKIVAAGGGEFVTKDACFIGQWEDEDEMDLITEIEDTWYEMLI